MKKFSTRGFVMFRSNISSAIILLTLPLASIASSLTDQDSDLDMSSYLFWLAIFCTLSLLIYGYRRNKQHQYSLKELKKSEDQLHWALWGSGDSLWDWDITNGIVHRRGLSELLGYHESEIMNTTAQFMELMHPDDSESVNLEINKHLKGESPHFEAEYRILSKDGKWRWILDKGKIVARDEQGQPIRAAGTQTDITERKRSEEELRLAAEVIQSMNEVVVITDEHLSVQLVNHAFIRLMGRQEGEVINRPIQHFFSNRHNKEFYTEIINSLRVNGCWQGQLWQKSANDHDILTRMEIKRVERTKKDQQYFVAIFSDITDKKRAEDKLIYLANYDTLTGLPNRALFHQRLKECIEQSHEQQASFSLICVDVDHFKHINDSLGHSIGDQLLQRVALKLKQQVPFSNATVARLAGDEFTLLLPGISNKETLIELSTLILTGFEKPILVENHEITISPSLGVGRFPFDGTDSMSLLRNTESALHFAKSKGRRNYQFFNEDIQTATLRKLTLGNHLRRALEKNELELVYQPKLSLSTNQLTGMEALLRWHNTDIGAIEPSEFIAIAEETGVVNEIGLWVLQQACLQARRWELQLQSNTIPVSVNISARQFSQPDLYKTIANVLAESQLSPELLELEITETMLMEDPNSAITTLNQLKEMGVSIAVDDFGTGYSSLSYLKDLPINTLKIDKAFVQDVSHDKDDEAIILAIISLSKNLGLNVIAEGVETLSQLQFLKESGCEQVQGYLIAPPMTSEETLWFAKEIEYRA